MSSVANSVALSVTLSGSAARTRVVERELPAVVGEIRNEIRHRIAVPLTASLAVANDTFLHAWENDGLPETGVPAWLKYAGMVKQKNQADVVFWISEATGKYYTDAGLTRQIGPQDTWFTDFLSGGKPYRLDIDRDSPSAPYMLFINVRTSTADGKLGVAGLGLSIVRSVAHAHGGDVHASPREDGGLTVQVRIPANV